MSTDAVFHRILAAIDDSAAADCALALATTLALRDGATLVLCSVVDRPAAYAASAEAAGMNPVPLLESFESQVRARLEQAARELRAARITVEEQMPFGVPAAEIITAAKASVVDLIVIGTHGRGGIERLVLGSVAADVMRASPVPVLVVGAQCARKG